MSLRALPTDPHFVTSTDKLLDRLYIPALERSISYDRGVGYFTSSWLRLAATGLVGLAANGGHGRIIASPMLDRNDCAALCQGVDARNDPKLRIALEHTIDDLESDLAHDTLSALAWMIADDLLDFRVAIPTGDLDGDFHDKFGIFRDSADDAIAFHGSPNDSERAFRNYESISVYYSWLDGREAVRVENEQNRFNLIWNNGDVNLRVYGLPDAVRRHLIAFTSRSTRPYPNPTGSPLPDERWRHQKDAAAAFLKAQHGILEMATGTGKTRTALNILEELRDRELVKTAIVTASGTDLLLQWHKELITKFDLPIFRHFSSWNESSDFMACAEPKILLISRSQLKNIIPFMADDGLNSALIICDEVHGMGSPSMVRDLSGQLSRFKYRLGLSATPEREYDQDGNDFIEAEIGTTIFHFTLEDAIKRGILCEFDYHPIHYELSDDDRAAIRQAIKRHHGRKASGEYQSDEVLYREIAMVRKTTIEKIAPFEQYLVDRGELLKNCLIFVETASFGALVQPILMTTGVPYHTYYQSEHAEKLKQFADGKLDCLVSCHRLSEGIDIQSVQNIVLFSSSRARLETIQRLGRCLRTDPTNPDKRALVIDFVDFDDGKNSTDIERHDWFTTLASVKSLMMSLESKGNN